jgi:hypothetical protein
MAVSDFLPFAIAANALVTAQDVYAALPAVQTGFQEGVAEPDQFNKAMRQASFVAAAMAKFAADYTGLDVRDDANLTNFISKFRSAIGPDYAEDTSNSANTITLQVPSYGTGIQPGRIVSFKVKNTNTGATVISLNGVTLPLRYADGAELVAGELPAGRTVYVGITSASAAVMVSPSIKLSSNMFNSFLTQFYLTPVSYWRMDSPIQSLPPGSLIRIQNYTNLYHTMGANSVVNQNAGTVTIGAGDAGVYILVGTNAMDIPTNDETIAIFLQNAANPGGTAIAISRGVSNPDPNNAMDKSVSAMIRLNVGDIVWAAYLQQNPTNSNGNTLNIPLGHFGGGRFGG